MAWAEDETVWNLIDGVSSSTNKAIQLINLCSDHRYEEVLHSSPATELLLPFAQVLLSTNHQSNAQGAEWAPLRCSLKGLDRSDCLAIAVASLQAFIQSNWTGPDLSEEIIDLVLLLRRHSPDALPIRSTDGRADEESERQIRHDLNQACLEELTRAGEPVYHLCKAPFLLLLSLQILEVISTDNVAAIWWRFRAASIHSRILDNPILPEKSVLDSTQVIHTFLCQRANKASTEREKSHWSSLLARLYVDKGLLQQRCGYDKVANELFLEAANVNKLNFRITGAMGRRTKFQKDEKTILVLLAESSLQEEDAKPGVVQQDSAAEEKDDKVSVLNMNNSGWKAMPSTKQAPGMPSEMDLNDETLLEQTRFSSTKEGKDSLSHLDPANPQPLDPLDSSILLALSLNISNASPENGLTSSQISAFVSRVLTHARNWSVHTLALLLRSRLEANRTKTAQRSVLQMQALLDQLPTSDSTIAERLMYFHELELPSTWELQAELARRYAALGVIRSALEIFEKIEMWEEAVQCWGALGRQDRGIEVVKDLLEGRKVEVSQAIQEKKKIHQGDKRETMNKARQAKLWCLLGDLEVEKAQEHYFRAWQISLNRSARAARSLGAAAFARNDLQQTILWLRRGLQINPLYTRSWFMLGCAYMKLDNSVGFLEAARCFRRCTALDDEDGESWNNLASCYLRLSQQGQIALQEAHQGTARDAEEVLSGLQEENDVDDQSKNSIDSGVPIKESQKGDSADGAISGSSTAFDIKLLAHRALTKSLRLSHDDWRLWNNYMIVSVDCGLMGEAVRGMTRVIELKSSKSAQNISSSGDKESWIDQAVLNRLVDAVIRAPSDESDGKAKLEPDQIAHHSPHEGHGLYPALINLFTKVILPQISSSAAIFRSYARLLIWRGLYRSALETHLNAWRVSYGNDANTRVTTEKEAFIEAIEELSELCEILENFAERMIRVDENGHECENKGVAEEEAMSNWKFKGRSLIRSFISRTRDSFEGEVEWENLVALRDSFAK